MRKDNKLYVSLKYEFKTLAVEEFHEIFVRQIFNNKHKL